MAVYQTTLPSFLACSSDPSCARISRGVRRIGIKSRNTRKFRLLVIIVFPSLVKTRLKVISLTGIFPDWIFSPRGWPSFAPSDQSLPGVYPEGQKFTRVGDPRGATINMLQIFSFHCGHSDANRN